MATHNDVRILGYLTKDPNILNEGQEGIEQALFIVRTVHREFDGYMGNKFQEIMIFYDGKELMQKVKGLQQYDVVDIAGVFNICAANKTSKCTECMSKNIKRQGSITFVYPISLRKLNTVRQLIDDKDKKNDYTPDDILVRHYSEISNKVTIVGTVVSDPELVKTKYGVFCRYRLGVDRKYYIKTQSDITADYPWVYSYGKQAEMDAVHLQQGTVVLVYGFMQNRKVKVPFTCESCGITYLYKDYATEFIPYSVEYLSDYITDEEIAKKKMM